MRGIGAGVAGAVGGVVVGAVIMVLAAASGCSPRTAYTCTDSSQCVLAGEQGTCELEGFCSFGDDGCPGGSRFEPGAGDGLGGMCAGTVPPDAPTICGGVGEACCASAGAAPCTGGAFCASGTCQECVTDLAMGHDHGCFLAHDGTVWCSGENYTGQLGNGMTSSMPTSTPVQVSTGAGPLTDAIAVAGGYDWSCAVRAGGEVWCWGDGTGGELGSGEVPAADAATPVRVVQADLTPLTGIVEIAAGYNHTCGRDGAGGVWCWGRANSGQLGDGIVPTTAPYFRNAAAPVLVEPGGEPFTGAEQLAVGANHACVVKAGSEVWCWGSDSNGELGGETAAAKPTPVRVATSTAIGMGLYSTCFVNADGTASCMGANWHGTIGNGLGGDHNGASERAPVTVLTATDGPPLMGVTALRGGGSMTCAIASGGQVWCWGDNKHGQVGGGSSTSLPQPVLFRTEDGAMRFDGADRLVGFWNRMCAHRPGDSWWCWGMNRNGELGDNTFASRGLAAPLALGVACP